MIVADASALVHAVAVGGPSSDLTLDRLVDNEVHCPAHVDAEVGHALRRFVLADPTTAGQAERALHRAGQLVTVRHQAPGMLATLAWSMRERVSFYDGLYVALALALDAPLLTADARLARAGLPCHVDVI